MMEKILCTNCKWYVANATCMAFPKGIPEEIIAGSNSHSQIVYGQSGNFMFTPKNNNDGVRPKPTA